MALSDKIAVLQASSCGLLQQCEDVGNPKKGILSFDNSWHAALTVWQVIMLYLNLQCLVDECLVDDALDQLSARSVTDIEASLTLGHRWHRATMGMSFYTQCSRQSQHCTLGRCCTLS